MSDFETREAIETLKRQKQDFADLQNELAGRDNGKISRFVTDEERKRRSGQQTSAEQAARTQLQLMLMQPEYAQAYQDAMHALNSAEGAVYDALTDSSDALEDAQKALEDAIENGASEEEIERLRERYKEAQERHERMLAREAELEAIRRRMEDPDNPLSPEELEELEKRAREIGEEANQDKIAKQSVDVSEPEKPTTPNASFSLGGFNAS